MSAILHGAENKTHGKISSLDDMKGLSLFSWKKSLSQVKLSLNCVFIKINIEILSNFNLSLFASRSIASLYSIPGLLRNGWCQKKVFVVSFCSLI